MSIVTKAGTASGLRLLPAKFPAAKAALWSGLGIAALYLIVLLLIPHNGFWTLDNGLKYLAIRSQIPDPFQSLNISIPDRQIDPWNEATPLIPPFIHREDGRIIPVFPPIFIALCSLLWSLAGEWTLLWIPWIAALGVLLICCRGFSSDQQQSSITILTLMTVASPLLFYALTLWEHTLAMLCVIGGVALTMGDRESSSLWRWFFAGILLGLSGIFRLEGWIVALSWTIVTFRYRNRVQWTLLVVGLVLTAGFWVASNFWWTGSLLPLQFMENLKTYGASGGHSGITGWMISRGGTAANLLFSANPNVSITILLNAALIVGIAVLLISRRPTITKIGVGVVMGAYLAFLVLEWRLAHPVASTLFTGGLLWCCPWVIFAIPIMRPSPAVRRLLIASLLSIVIIILITPISHGIHFGPRILLTVIPLLAVAVAQVRFPAERQHYFQITAIVLLCLTIVHQGYGITVLARQKSWNAELASRTEKLKDKIIVTDLWWVPADMARTWDKHSYFFVPQGDVLEDLLFHMKINNVDQFAYYSESPATLANFDLPINVLDRSIWDIGERRPTVVERIVLTDNSLKWAALATKVGLRQYRMEELDRALIPLEDAVAWNDSDPDAWYRLGTLKLQMWDEKGAREAFENAVKIDSTHQRALKALQRLREER
jgi:hypothetical protein